MKETEVTKIQYEQLTCNLDNKYYNALKDKVNLVAMCYFESTMDNVEEKKNAFTKKMVKVGELTDRKRVMIFADDDNAIDTKSHFEYITSKIELDAQGFIDAVEEAIQAKLAATNGTSVKKKVKSKPVKEEPVPEPVVEDDLDMDTDMDDIDEPTELIVDIDELKTEIRNKNKAASPEIKKTVKAIIAEHGGKLDLIEDAEVLNKILELY